MVKFPQIIEELQTMQMESTYGIPVTRTRTRPLADQLGSTAEGTSVNLYKRTRVHESIIQMFLWVCGVISIFTTIGIIAVLGKESLSFFSRQLWQDTNHTLTAEITTTTNQIDIGTQGLPLESGATLRIGDEVMTLVSVDLETGAAIVERGVQHTNAIAHQTGSALYLGDRATLTEFFTNTKWIPQLGEFGVLPLINATLMTSAIAMLVALPLGLGAAIYMSEYASPRVRAILKPILELLAGIPTVVFGYFALTFMTPLLRGVLGIDNVEIFNTASAGIVVGILIIPLVSSMAEDALSAVPMALREASYGLGANRFETTVKVVIPAAFSGIVAAFIVAISRAIGETMVVAIAAGAGPEFTGNPFAAAETMTGHIARISGGDLSYNSVDYNSIFAIGLTLFVMTLVLNIVSRNIINRFREAY
jgi:phosphate transport system permease protein